MSVSFGKLTPQGTCSREEVDAWLAEARRGSEVALGQLLSAAQRYLLAIANRSLPEALRAKLSPSDLVQETSLEAFQDFTAFDGQHFDELLAWLRMILLNNLANSVRYFEQTQKRQVPREVPLDGPHRADGSLADPNPTPSKDLIAHERGQELQRALQRLPAQMQSAIVLRNREHLSFSEIGVQLHRSPEAARKLWARAIERLQHELR
jgi:RNA polymerase sigma-70 factor (ECF subfamily)